MADFYALRRKLGLTGFRERLGLVRREPTPLETAIALIETGETGETACEQRDAMVARLIDEYRRGVVEFGGYGDSMWAGINRLAAPMHALLMQGSVEQVSFALNHPHRTNLFLGFDNPVAATSAPAKGVTYCPMRSART